MIIFKKLPNIFTIYQLESDFIKILMNNNSDQNINPIEKSSLITASHKKDILFKFSVINPNINRRSYYYKKYFTFTDLSKCSNWGYLLSQERNFLDLIVDLNGVDELSAWLK